MLNATKLIMVHGGTVTTEPDDDTITLSPPNGTSTADYARFSINWIHDCISANKFVDIMKYVLPLSKLSDNPPSVESESAAGCHGNLNRKVNRVRHGSITISTADSTSRDAPSSPTNPETSEIEEIWSDVVNQSCYKEDFKEDVNSNSTNDVKTPQMPELITISSDSEDENFDEVKNSDKYKQSLNESVAEPGTNCGRVLRKSERRSLPRINYPDKKNCIWYSEEEHQMMVDYLIENNAILKAGSKGVWKEAKAKGMFVEPPRSADSLSMQFLNRVRGNIGKYTADPLVLKKFAQREKRAQKRPVAPHYSKQEDKQIIECVIENRAIRAALHLNFWRKIEAAKIFENPHRPANGLRGHFVRHLLRNYKNYTKDPEARREFERCIEELKIAKNTNSVAEFHK